MVKQLQKVLEKIIVPNYEGIMYVEVTHLGTHQNWYRVIYYIVPPLTSEFAMEIMEETVTIYRMIGDTGGDIFVEFEDFENE